MASRYPSLFAVALALAACAGSPPKSEEEALLQARNPKLQVSWASPDTRVPPFDRVLLAPIELEFRPADPVSGPLGTPQTRTEFPVPEHDRQRLARDFDEILREELGDNPRIRLTDDAGPGVLVVKPALRDIVSRVPPEEPPGRSDTYVDSVAEATLVVDIVDGATGRTLGRTSDRRTAERVGSMGSFAAVRTGVEADQEVRRLARRWAMNLEKRLDQVYFEAKPK
jgi:hypothetical protein